LIETNAANFSRIQRIVEYGAKLDCSRFREQSTKRIQVRWAMGPISPARRRTLWVPYPWHWSIGLAAPNPCAGQDFLMQRLRPRGGSPGQRERIGLCIWRSVHVLLGPALLGLEAGPIMSLAGI
jgi:hypothetical protein